MNDTVNWSNPYADRKGSWLKGNLHTHTSPASSCADMSLQEALDAYVREGYDFVAISDHNVFTEVDDPRLVVIPGLEWNSEDGEHTGVYSADAALVKEAAEIVEQKDLLVRLREQNGLTILNHPNWGNTPHYSREALAARDGNDGMEILNVVMHRLPGWATATEKWDYVLTNGKRVLGFAGEDAHIVRDIGRASLRVRAAEKSVECILSALKQGNFYCSSGVTISDIRREGDVLTVETEDAEELQVLCDSGTVLETVRGTSISTDLTKPGLSYVDPTYVRIEAFGIGSTMAWTQPFFING